MHKIIKRGVGGPKIVYFYGPGHVGVACVPLVCPIRDTRPPNLSQPLRSAQKLSLPNVTLNKYKINMKNFVEK